MNQTIIKFQLQSLKRTKLWFQANFIAFVYKSLKMVLFFLLIIIMMFFGEEKEGRIENFIFDGFMRGWRM
jgi:hypothetical protein